MNKRYKGFWIRFLAFIIDLVLIILLNTLLKKAGLNFSFITNSFGYGITSVLLVITVRFIIIFFFWRLFAATPGKMIIGAKIADAKTGSKPTTLQFIKRYIGYFISLNPLLLGFLWSGWDKNKQAIHDKFAGTVVISRKTKEISTRTVSIGFMKYVFGVFFFLFVFGSFILSPQMTSDVAIAEYTDNWKSASLPEPNPIDNGYYNLVGLFTTKNKDPFAEGYDYIKKTNEITMQKINDPTFIPNESKIKTELTASLYPEEIINIVISNSLQTLLDNQEKINELFKEYSYIEPRFEELLAQKYIRDTKIPNHEVIVLTPFVEYYRLVNAKVIIDYINGNKKDAIVDLERYLIVSRYLSKNSSLLIEKLVFIITTQITLNTYSKLMDYEFSSEIYDSIRNISEFTDAENSMRKAMQSESMFSHPEYGLPWITNSETDLMSSLTEKSDISIIMYKPNLSFNTKAESLNKLADIAELTGDEFINAYNKLSNHKTNFWNYIRNPIGSAIASESIVSNIYFTYILKNKLLGAKIVLLKLKAEIINQNMSSNQITEFLQNQPKKLCNPISNKPILWDSLSKELFIYLPIEIEDEPSMRMNIELK